MFERYLVVRVIDFYSLKQGFLKKKFFFFSNTACTLLSRTREQRGLLPTAPWVASESPRGLLSCRTLRRGGGNSRGNVALSPELCGSASPRDQGPAAAADAARRVRGRGRHGVCPID